MPDAIRKVDYFSTMVTNTPGQTFRVISKLVSSGGTRVASTALPGGRPAQIDVVPDDNRRFNAAARKARLKFNPKKTGFLIQGDDRPGALADNLRKLAEAKVNVTAVDGLSAGRGRWGAILWVKPGDVRKAGKVLGAKAR